MKLFSYILLIISFSIAAGCGDTKKEDALYQEMITIHDEVMPKMGDIMRLKRELENADELEQEQKTRAIRKLEEADEAMMQWMRTLKPKDSLDGHNAVMSYYKAKKEDIKEVREKMLKAIEDAERLLEQKK